MTIDILQWALQRRDRQLLKKYGGIQRCPWCRQTANQGTQWGFKAWDRDPFIDVLTCGVCEGTSLWRFELGMIYIGALNPPKPSMLDNPGYSIAFARLK